MATFIAPQEARRDALIKGGAVITMDPALGDLAKGDILIRNGRIAEIAPSIVADDVEIIDASAMVVMPGFIDGHRHMWEGVVRNSLPTEDLNGYFQLVNQGFAPAYTPEDAYIGTLVSAIGALDAGITTVFDWSHIQTTPDHTRASVDALRASGLRAVFGFGMPGSEDKGHQWPHDLLRLQKDEFNSTDDLITLALASLSPEHVPDEMARAHFQLARDAGLIISVHAGLNGMGEPHQIERFGREGLLGPYVNLVHCNTLSPEEWHVIADTGTSVCITPSTEMQMGQGIPPIQPALDVGIKPAIGVDVETSVPGDMWTQMRIIYALQRMNAFEKHYAGESAPTMMDCDDILECATVAGAKSARLEGKTGSLAPGKAADIIMLRTDMLNVMPINDLKTAVVLNMDARNVDSVMVDGAFVKRSGRMLGVDLQKLSAQLYASRDGVFERSGVSYRTPLYR